MTNSTRTLLLALTLAMSSFSCQTLSRQPDLGEAAYRSPWAPSRTPAALKCDIDYVDAEILKSIPTDPGLQTQVSQIREYLKRNGQLKKIIPMSDEMLEFRKQYLPFLKIDSAYREGIIRWMEGGLRLKSSLTEKVLADPQTFLGRANAQYDFVVVGSGVHGTLAVAELLQKNPNYKILVIEASDTAAANFRYAGDTFSINSSNRASGTGSVPLPGQGNINELPGLPIQVSDISAVKYPSANDLGSSLVAGLYASVSRYKNVDIVFNTELLNASKKKISFDGASTEGFEITAKKEGLRKFPNIQAKKMIVASGLGTPTLPPGVKRSVTQFFPELVQTADITKTLPRVMTFEDVMRALAQSNNPRGYFANKTVAVVGTGDSANVFIEFMLGYATPGAYGFSSAQIRGPKRVFWIGQKRSTCEAYIADARSRYAQIGTGYRSSDPDALPIIEAIDDRLDSVAPVSETQALLKLQNTTGQITADVVILATGFESQLRKVLAGVVNEGTGATNAATDAEFLERGFDYLSGKTSVSSTVTRIARTPKGSANGKLIIVGPGAGRLPQDEELVGIIQNTVSIFNNAPRTVSASRSITSGVKPLSGSRTNAIQLKLARTNTSRIVEIGGMSETRLISNATTPYLSSVLTSVLSKIELPSSYRGDEFLIGFKLSPDGKKIQLFSLADNINLTPVAEALAETRDFFNLTYQVLAYNRNQGIYLKAIVEDGAIDLSSAKLSFDRAASTGDATVNPGTIQNSSIVLRGIQ